MVDGSNETLYYPDEESGLNLRTGTPLQKSFEKVDVVPFMQYVPNLFDNEASKL